MIPNLQQLHTEIIFVSGALDVHPTLQQGHVSITTIPFIPVLTMWKISLFISIIPQITFMEKPVIENTNFCHSSSNKVVKRTVLNRTMRQT